MDEEGNTHIKGEGEGLWADGQETRKVNNIWNVNKKYPTIKWGGGERKFCDEFYSLYLWEILLEGHRDVDVVQFSQFYIIPLECWVLAVRQDEKKLHGSAVFAGGRAAS